MAQKCFVGFDTSNYTTSAAVCTEDGKVIANIKIPLTVKSGERGLRQSDAVFSHVKNLPQISEKLKLAIGKYEVAAVAYSGRPRDVEGSYMPCFLSGKVAAYAFAAALKNVPVYEFSHQNGHVVAAVYSAMNNSDKECAEDLLSSAHFGAFHVSGGTTEVLSVKPDDKGLSVSLEGMTADLNAGQVIDRVGVLMGLSFPCGREMEELAKKCEKKIPKPSVCTDGCVCNLSGLENKAKKLYEETADKALVSAYVIDFIAETLFRMSMALLEKYDSIPILYAGGVMSNRRIAQRLKQLPTKTYFAEPEFSADNAAGCALLCKKRYDFESGDLK